MTITERFSKDKIEELIEFLKRYPRWRVKGKALDRPIHILAVLEDECVVVYKYWGRHGWNYKVEELFYMHILLEDGRLERRR